MDNFSLIYEFNNNSPLFVKAAEKAIAKGQFDKAINILEKGLELFPDYQTAYILYAKALTLIGDTEKAEIMLKKGCEKFNNTKTFDYYKNEFLHIQSNPNKNIGSKMVSFVSSQEEEESLESEFEKEAGNELEDLAKQLDNAKISSEDDIDFEFEDIELEESEDDIVSETIANIYKSQGNFEQAKKTYQQLIEMQPEKKELFQKEIDEINQTLQLKKDE